VFDDEAKERKKRKPESVKENLPEQNKGQSRDKAGESVAVSGKSIDAGQRFKAQICASKLL
jgi:hypothetical protein